MVVFERLQRFGDDKCRLVAKNLSEAARAVGASLFPFQVVSRLIHPSFRHHRLRPRSGEYYHINTLEI